MGEILRGYSIATLCGWAVFPFLHLALARLPDRGYAASRCFGLIASTWVAFLFVALARRPLGTGVCFGAIAVVAAAGWGTRAFLLRAGAGSRAVDEGIIPFLRRKARIIAALEIIVLAGLLLFSWILRRNPAIDPDSERFMDYAFLKAYLRSPGLPVADPWFAGRPMNYYHFGYAVAAFVVRACGSDPARLFTTVLALLYALVWAGAFGIGLALTGRARGGAAAAFLVLGAGNLEWVRQCFERGGIGGFDWFGSSRVIQGAITEFPWFSLLWGDLHPYVVALPVLLTALAFVVAESVAPGDRERALAVPLGRASGFALLAGALLAIHAWDVPILILAGAAAVGSGNGDGRAARALLVPLCGAFGALLFLPFFQGIDQGGRSLVLVRQGSRPAELAMAFGPFLLLGILVPLALAARRRAPEGDGGVPAGAPGVAAAFACCGVLAVAACELVYLRDFFSATDLARMNTVFKMHRLAWLLLGLASPVLAEMAILRQGGARAALRGLASRAALLLALGGASVYPIVGTASWLRAREASRSASESAGAGDAEAPGADAERKFATLFPGDAAAAAYLAVAARPGEAVLEETGEAYSWSSRIATFSGVPSVLGWGNHEAGWRDDWEPVLRRRSAIESIYGDPSSDRSRDLLRRYGVAWVVVGERERRRYGTEGPAAFSRLGHVALEAGGTLLYRLEPGP